MANSQPTRAPARRAISDPVLERIEQLQAVQRANPPASEACERRTRAAVRADGAAASGRRVEHGARRGPQRRRRGRMDRARCTSSRTRTASTARNSASRCATARPSSAEAPLPRSSSNSCGVRHEFGHRTGGRSGPRDPRQPEPERARVARRAARHAHARRGFRGRRAVGPRTRAALARDHAVVLPHVISLPVASARMLLAADA